MSEYSTASGQTLIAESKPLKKDADYVFYELTRSICPECRKVIDAKILPWGSLKSGHKGSAQNRP